jgi:hypothetical protein
MKAFLGGGEEEPKKKAPVRAVDGELDQQTPGNDIAGEEGPDFEDDPFGDTEDEGGEDEYEEEDPTEPDDESEEPSLWTVKVNGVETQVPEDELVRGYSRQAHFTQSMQALATERAAFEATRAAVAADAQAYSALLPKLRDYLASGLSNRTPEDWATLEREDPIGYLTQRQKEAEQQERIRGAEQEMQLQNGKLQEEQEAVVQQIKVQEGRKLLGKLPAWRDSKVAQRESAAMASYASGLGFSDQEIDGIIDHRLVLLLRDATQYSVVRTKREGLKPTKRSTTAARPGSNQRSPQPKLKRQARESRAKLKATGRVEDAAAALKHIL